MRVTDEIVKTYLDGGDIVRYREQWYFNKSAHAVQVGKNIFLEPVYDQEKMSKIKLLQNEIKAAAAGFIPTNQRIWDLLVPDWREIIESVTIDLILGFPEPYDATVDHDPEGKLHVIFDLMCWTKYVGVCKIKETMQNLLTHELFHVLIGTKVSDIDDDTESEDYFKQLDALMFHEAFAHLVSYQSKEIDTVDWHTAELEQVKQISNQRMSEIIKETNKEKQKKNLREGTCGRYYDKFICMSGMLYLVYQWETGGIQKLRKEFQDGYHKFAKKVTDAWLKENPFL